MGNCFHTNAFERGIDSEHIDSIANPIQLNMYVMNHNFIMMKNKLTKKQNQKEEISNSSL